MSIVEHVEKVVDAIAVFERGAWYAAVRVRAGDDYESGKLTVFRNFVFDDAHQAVRAARQKAVGF